MSPDTPMPPDAVLRSARARRLLSRAVAKGEIQLPAVPAMLDDYQALCVRTFEALGVAFSAEQQARLRQVLADQLAAAWAASPRSEILITYDSPVGLAVNYYVKPLWSSVGATYDNWVATREPPYFGALPDARVWSLASELGNPKDCPVLDVGAGIGRNALALARRGHAVDAIELSGKFASMLRAEAAKEALPVRVLQRDAFATSDDLRRDYGLMVCSEVVSDFRSVDELRKLLVLAETCLAVGGKLVFNLFLPQAGYEPDAATRELGQQVYTSVFTRAELEGALAGLALDPLSEDSVFDYERQHLPASAWPPTGWYINWVKGLDLFDVSLERSPIELRWLVYRKSAVPGA